MPEKKMIVIPARTSKSKCRSCGQLIYWAPHPASGRAHPVSVDDDDAVEPTGLLEGKGISHFADCPNADQHRRPR
jgi:hypothetical protein